MRTQEVPAIDCSPGLRRVTATERGQTKERLVYTRPVPWYHVLKMPVLLGISRDPEGKERDDFFFTTDLSLTAAQGIGGANE